MRSFTSFTSRSFAKLSKAPVQEVVAGTMYFLSRSRNAWFAARSERYFPGCMHQSLEGAQVAAEKLRACGSVFIIEEQPALFLMTTEGVAGLTEINSQRPVERFDRGLASNETWSTTSPLRLGNSVSECVKSFMSMGHYWRPIAEWKNLIVVGTQARGLNIQPLLQRNLKAWTSRPQGPHRNLAWDEYLSGIKSSPVIALARSINEVAPGFPPKGGAHEDVNAKPAAF